MRAVADRARSVGPIRTVMRTARETEHDRRRRNGAHRFFRPVGLFPGFVLRESELSSAVRRDTW